MNCPICEKAGIPENAAVCPQCNSNLVGFVLLKRIKNKEAKLQQKLKIAVIIAAILLIFNILWAFSFFF